jgi:voltage-gated sodium channel
MAAVSSAGRDTKKPKTKGPTDVGKGGEEPKQWADKVADKPKLGDAKDDQMQDIVPGKSKAAQEEEDCYANRKWILPAQEAVARKYDSPASQIGVACVIFLNFFISMGQAQALPEEGSGGALVFLVFEYIFNIIFGVELIINMYANWYMPFWTNGWNVFDFLIVIISWLSMVADNLPGISVLRLFRAFRVFRLFKRIPALRLIIVGILKSLPGIANAGVVLALIMGMWAVMGVTFFGEEYPDEFGCFTKAMLTCVQMMTWDSWVSGITRPIVLHYQDWKVPFYFVTYAFFTAIIMANVLIAILVDKYTEAVKAADIEEEEEQASGYAQDPDEVKQLEDEVKKAKEQINNRILLVKTHIEELGAKMPEAVVDVDILPHQERVRNAFEDPKSQVVMAVVICVNFCGSAVQMQLKPLDGSSTQQFFTIMEYGFNTFFLVELIINMYANFWYPFWRSGWNVFDLFIVIVGWIAMLSGDTNVAVLRMFRAVRRSIVAFRVVKLLRLKQLKIIVVGVMRSITGVSYAFLLLGIVMGIWSIMGVDFFGDDWPDEFGNFLKAMLTMFQIMSFDSWSSGIARPIIVDDERSDDFKSGLFFMTYVFISAIIMMNVVLAILIDNFLAAAKEVTDEEAKENKERAQAAGEEDPDHCCLELTKSVNIQLEELEKLIKGPFVEYYAQLKADVEYCQAANGNTSASSAG